MLKQHDQLVKIILTGTSGVGKSAILTQFADNKFNQAYMTTIGVDFRFKKIAEGNRTIKLQIWDTAGQQRFRTITSAYYKGTDAIVMVFDLTVQKTLQDLQKVWIPQAYTYCDKSIDIYVFGNKQDLDGKIKTQKIQQLAAKYNFKYVPVSAKTGLNIDQMMKQLGIKVANKKLKKMYGQASKQPENKPVDAPQKIDISNNRVVTKNSKRCC